MEGYLRGVFLHGGGDAIDDRFHRSKDDGFAAHQTGVVDGGANLVPQAIKAVERDEAPTATSQGADASAAGSGAVDFLQLPTPVAEVRRLVLVDTQLYVLGVVPLESVGDKVV